MSSGETDKMMNITSDIISKILQQAKEHRERTMNLTAKLRNEIDIHSKDMQDYIDNENLFNDSNENGLSKEDVEGILNHHFKQVEELSDNVELDNIDIDTFKNKLDGLTNDFKNNVKSKGKSKKTPRLRSPKNLKGFAKSRINRFMNKMNDRFIKRSRLQRENSLENKANMNKKLNDETKNLTYEQKIERSLRNNPELLKDAVVVTQIHSMNKHIQESLKQLENLNEIGKENPAEKDKINEMKVKLNSHINEMEYKVNELSKSNTKEDTIEKLKDSTNEKENNKELEIEEKTTEVTLER